MFGLDNYMRGLERGMTDPPLLHDDIYDWWYTTGIQPVGLAITHYDATIEFRDSIESALFRMAFNL